MVWMGFFWLRIMRIFLFNFIMYFVELLGLVRVVFLQLLLDYYCCGRNFCDILVYIFDMMY